MPVSVACPSCSRKLRIEDDLVGKKVRCPDCKTIFIGDPNGPQPVAATPPASTGVSTARDEENRQLDKSTNGADDYQEEPRTRKRRGRRDDEDEDDEDGGETRRLKSSEAREGWRWTGLGVSLCMYGLQTFLVGSTVLLAGWLFSMILGVIAGTSGQGTIVAVSFILFIIECVVFGGCTLAAIILSSIGHGFFSQVPNQPDTNLRPLSIGAMALWFGSLLLILSGYAGTCVTSGVDARFLMLVYSCSSLLSFLASLAWFFVFWLFMRAICLECRDKDLARTTIYVMVVIPVYVVVGFLVLFMLSFLIVGGIALGGARAGVPVGAFILVVVAYFAFIIIFLCLLLWASLVLPRIRKAIEWQMRRRGD